ncbi:hypothetical protein K501DRAFT_336060 [Backusella circina FSU 941]|nr:hypothetical protein K501DRAFT_336060 [Backusella circina FSU 941]
MGYLLNMYASFSETKRYYHDVANLACILRNIFGVKQHSLGSPTQKTATLYSLDKRIMTTKVMEAVTSGWPMFAAVPLISSHSFYHSHCLPHWPSMSVWTVQSIGNSTIRDLVPGTRFPLYGYASARTAITDVGLLAPDASRTEKYLYMIDQVSVLKYNLKWTITDQVPTGRYQIGVGFFYHETSPEILIV